MGTKNSCKTAAVMGLIGRGSAAEGAPLEEGHTTDLARTPEIIYAEINFYSGTMLSSAIEIGRRMVELKGKLPHGSFIDEIKKNTPWSRSQINNFMRLFREYGNSNVQTFGHLSPSKALALLALPEAEREEFLGETHEVNGEEKTVIDMSARELAQAVKERDEALKAAAQAQAEQSAAEQAREKIAADMALANGRMEGLRDELTAQAERLEAARENAARLEKELEELRSRPVDVAVEADPAAIEAARKEAEAAMQTQLDKVKKAVDNANKARKAAEKDLEDAHRVLAKMRDENCVLREKMERADKKASLAANEDFVLFKTILERLQEDGNRLCGLILKERNKDQKMAEGFFNAFLACLDKMREGAQG